MSRRGGEKSSEHREDVHDPPPGVRRSDSPRLSEGPPLLRASGGWRVAPWPSASLVGGGPLLLATKMKETFSAASSCTIFTNGSEMMIDCISSLQEDFSMEVGSFLWATGTEGA